MQQRLRPRLQPVVQGPAKLQNAQMHIHRSVALEGKVTISIGWNGKRYAGGWLDSLLAERTFRATP